MFQITHYEAGQPDLFIRAEDDTWCPTYRMRDRVIDRVFRTTFYVHHERGVVALTEDRVIELADEGRVLKTTAYVARLSADNGAEDRAPEPSARLRQLDEGNTGEQLSRWERLRRLLCARVSQLVKHMDASSPQAAHDNWRHTAAFEASSGRTESSRELSESEMEDAITYIEHELYVRDFDIEAADEAYRARRAAQSTTTLRKVA